MTLGTAIDDIMLRIYKGAGPSDDGELSRAQVQHLLAITRDDLAKQFLDTQIKAGAPIDSSYLERETSQAALSESESDVDEEDERLYVTLDKQPLSLIDDRGVVKVMTDEYITLYRTRIENLDVVKNLRYATPSSQNMVWYRDNRKIIIEGLSYKNLNKSTFIVVYAPTLASQTLTESSELKISDELLPVLLEQVENIARREIYGSVADTENNGQDITVQDGKIPDSR